MSKKAYVRLQMVQWFMHRSVHRLKVRLRRLWLSKTCLLCSVAVIDEQPICEPCKLDLPWLQHGCQFCALPVPAGERSCHQCQQQLQPFRQAAAAWSYDFPVNTLISRFKYNSQWPYGRLLAQMLAEYLEFEYQEGRLIKADYLLAVPLANKRQRQRGYNQAQMIAQWLSKDLHIPLLYKAAQRIRYTSIQQGLTASQRHSNMRNAFRIVQPEQVVGRHIAIVDDVLTTGATCAALTRSLLAAGASRVDVYCLARTGFAAG